MALNDDELPDFKRLNHYAVLSIAYTICDYAYCNEFSLLRSKNNIAIAKIARLIKVLTIVAHFDMSVGDKTAIHIGISGRYFDIRCPYRLLESELYPISSLGGTSSARDPLVEFAI